jgi:hypothetical protein
LHAQTDASISDELRQVANGFAYRVRSFTDYDGRIEEPQIVEFLHLALMSSTIIEELKKYINFYLYF